jgi:hypothetical protein
MLGAIRMHSETFISMPNGDLLQRVPAFLESLDNPMCSEDGTRDHDCRQHPDDRQQEHQHPLNVPQRLSWTMSALSRNDGEGTEQKRLRCHEPLHPEADQIEFERQKAIETSEAELQMKSVLLDGGVQISTPIDFIVDTYRYVTRDILSHRAMFILPSSQFVGTRFPSIRSNRSMRTTRRLIQVR